MCGSSASESRANHIRDLQVDNECIRYRLYVWYGCFTHVVVVLVMLLPAVAGTTLHQASC